MLAVHYFVRGREALRVDGVVRVENNAQHFPGGDDWLRHLTRQTGRVGCYLEETTTNEYVENRICSECVVRVRHR